MSFVHVCVLGLNTEVLMRPERRCSKLGSVSAWARRYDILRLGKEIVVCGKSAVVNNLE